MKRRVYDRDEGLCIFCGRPGAPNAHVIARSHGGLGIDQNIVTACAECHRRMDNSSERKTYIAHAEEYLRGIYGDEAMEHRTYRKGIT